MPATQAMLISKLNLTTINKDKRKHEQIYMYISLHTPTSAWNFLPKMQMFLLWNLSSEGKQWGLAVFAGLLMGWVEYRALRDFWSFSKFSVPFGKWASQIQVRGESRILSSVTWDWSFYITWKDGL